MTKQIAIITGASRGLGRSMALHLAKRGVAIIGTYRSGAAEADTLRQEIEALGGKAAMIALDVSDAASFPAFAETVAETLRIRFGREQFDFLVNNAGHGLYALLTDATEEQFDSLIDTHLRGPVFLTQKLLPLIVDGGRILNVSSGFVRVTMAGYGLYAAAKAAIQTLTKFMAVELGARQIRVNTIAPGAIATDFGGGVVRDDANVNAYVAGTIALGRVGDPDDIGGAVAAILSDDMGWANGTTFDISGGQAI
ncbi:MULTISPECIES: SDR family NAD(P)-dependent oxidoreductase [Rhizobium]|uniref:3-oxoacyl-(Acyl-carrier-protein) reductase protein n=1 Tax=Rhizobium phaseoli TaxID=396 RepID=A0A192TJP3_9HYPH|nr:MULTISPECIES: SDR family oxidoreductase [Rhizobium]ANL43372.1 3-oxoacyl-(acyl-carrier-protein) reductase protein [Rhizobium phaseoli]ANL56372.1 3-oxoacyl-(acyl-carrier-protein) reductase protein [Rhizobium phaseoli]ANL62358.1 3-oxoacyl-(acyl-carrier-protein) reductase protein [Rhizobium phaseoli]ANL87772.1 3-oxoacyl-(acyl-carrier-protein) reductase protein [Rhizobium phaseoli]ANL94281.1 3-oxoacyl-(acyl-carrier-protein) reductase protein [Rhizobium phaseoli]